MPADDSRTATLQRLAEAHAALLLAERAELEAVAAARTAGATWQQIADQTGLKARQEAERKYAKRLIVEPAKVTVKE